MTEVEEAARPSSNGGGGGKRVILIEAIHTIDPETGEEFIQADEEQLHDIVSKLLGTLSAIGGTLHIAADRVKVGTASGQPIGRTIGYVIQYQAFSPLRDLEAPAESEPDIPDGEETA
jgi:hypothetical protein